MALARTTMFSAGNALKPRQTLTLYTHCVYNESWEGDRRMPKKPQAMIRLLKKHGFQEIKCNHGSHRRFYNPATGRRTEVPVHGNKELKKNLERLILEQAGIDEDGTAQ